ncbi:hypothetical protein [Desulfurobacterium sp.]
MIVRVEYPDGYGKNFDVNVLKADVRLSDRQNYDRLFVLLPAEKTTFRIRHFPFNDKRKILKIVENDIKSNPLLARKDLVYRSLFFSNGEGTTVFTVIAERKDVEEVEKRGADSLDSEVVSLLRIVLLNEKRDGEFYYPKEDSTIVISIKGGVPVSVRVFEGSKEEGELITLEGVDLKTLPLFGSALQVIKNMELNFLKEESSDIDVSLVRSAVFLLLSILILSGTLFAGGFFFKRKIRDIRRAEAVLFEKRFPDIPAVDPLTQLRGMLASKNFVEVDAADIMNYIGKMRKDAISILKFNAGDGRFSIEGEAPDISSVTTFADRLKKFNAEITETVTLKNKVRFRLEGRY